MYGKCLFFGLWIWNTQSEAKLHNDLVIPNVNSSFLGVQSNIFSYLLPPWYRRWLDWNILRQRNVTEILEEEKKKKEVTKSEYGGPARNKHYDPNFGYEQYWGDGNWVMEWFHKFQDQDQNLCDEKCVPMHDRFGKVCGRNKRLESKTFATMCAMKHYDCADDDGWVPVYRGECRPDLIYPKTFSNVDFSTLTPLPHLPLVPLYIREFEDRHPHLHFG